MLLKIIVIDDDQEILNMIELILTEEGHTVISSTNSTILADIDAIRPDLILLDVVLGNERGSDLCLQLKSDHKTEHIPVVFLSALTSISDLAQKAGANAYLRKPFDVNELYELIENVGKNINSESGR